MGVDNCDDVYREGRAQHASANRLRRTNGTDIHGRYILALCAGRSVLGRPNESSKQWRSCCRDGSPMRHDHARNVVDCDIVLVPRCHESQSVLGCRLGWALCPGASGQAVLGPCRRILPGWRAFFTHSIRVWVSRGRNRILSQLGVALTCPCCIALLGRSRPACVRNGFRTVRGFTDRSPPGPKIPDVDARAVQPET